MSSKTSLSAPKASVQIYTESEGLNQLFLLFHNPPPPKKMHYLTFPRREIPNIIFSHSSKNEVILNVYYFCYSIQYNQESSSEFLRSHRLFLVCQLPLQSMSCLLYYLFKRLSAFSALISVISIFIYQAIHLIMETKKSSYRLMVLSTC